MSGFKVYFHVVTEGGSYKKLVQVPFIPPIGSSVTLWVGEIDWTFKVEDIEWREPESFVCSVGEINVHLVSDCPDNHHFTSDVNWKLLTS